MSDGVADQSNSIDISMYYKTALDDTSWQSRKPIYNVAELFELPMFQKHYSYTIIPSPVHNVIVDVLKHKYPKLPTPLVTSILDYYINKELHPFPWSDLSAAQLESIRNYLQSKVDNSNSFPFPRIISPGWRVVQETRFGIRAFAHDIYQPILMQHRTRPFSFRDRTVGILMQCPTTVYDLPENISKEFPVSYLLCNPYFTMPRPVPAYLGGHTHRLSLFDMFASDHSEAAAAQMNSRPLADNIKLMYDDDKLVETATKLMRRAILTSGGEDGIKPSIEFADKQEWLLAKEMFRYKLAGAYSKQATLRFNIMEARNEATRRDRERKLEAAEQRRKELQEELVRRIDGDRS